MRYIKALLVVVLSIGVLGLTAKSASVNAQGQLPMCTDKTTLGTILSAMTQGPFVDAYGKLASAATPDDFGNVIDLGIQTRHAVMDLSINPSDQGCFFLQLSALSLVNDEVDAATYLSFVKGGLKNADAYQKGLTDAQTRLKKDTATFQALAQASAGTPAATQPAS